MAFVSFSYSKQFWAEIYKLVNYTKLYKFHYYYYYYYHYYLSFIINLDYSWPAPVFTFSEKCLEMHAGKMLNSAGNNFSYLKEKHVSFQTFILKGHI